MKILTDFFCKTPKVTNNGGGHSLSARAGAASPDSGKQ